MKKILYSKYTKFLAVLLLLLSLTLGLLSGIRGAELLYKEESFLYDFGKSFEECYYFEALLEEVEYKVLLPYRKPVEDRWREMETIEPTSEYTSGYEAEPTEFAPPLGEISLDDAELEKDIREGLDSLHYGDRVEYYVQWRGRVFTNCNAESADSLTEQGIYRYFSLNTQGNVYLDTSRRDYRLPMYLEYLEGVREPSDLIICTRIRQDYAEQCRQLWDRQEKILYTAGARVLCCVLLAVLLLIYLLCVCGRDRLGAPLESWTDRIWAEIHLVAMAAFIIGGSLVQIWTLDEAFMGQLPLDSAYLAGGLLMPLVGGVTLCSLLSLIRNVKNGCFVRRSLICFILIHGFRLVKKLCTALYRGLRRLIRSMAEAFGRVFTAFRIALLLGYTVIIIFLSILASESYSGGPLLLMLLPFGAGVYFIVRWGRDFHEIKEGAAQIRSGNVSYKLPEPKSADLRELGKNINDIAEGLNESVAAKVKAERMKTELITNVSHDLKTPLTSIINYTELLSKVEGLPEEARDYVSVIASKSDRLKRLTQDLFDISKAQSGNEEILWEKLDTQLLLQQTLGELDGEIRQSGLSFCVKTEPERYIFADGRKMSRVLGNLIQNALKYAMKNTRVYLSTREEEGQVLLEIKNISSYPMDFSAEEIIGRFVRGDSARSTEGSGLGLAIAKSYTELCGGEFRLTVDGDLFKVILRFPSHPAA